MCLNDVVMMRTAAIVLLFFFASCSEDGLSDESFDIGYEYFPLLSEGSSYLYEVELITYNNKGTEVKSEAFFQREMVISSEAEGLKGEYLSEIWTSRSGQEPWNFKENVRSEINNIQAISNEGGERIVKMSFPISIGKNWDGLAFLNDNQKYEINGETIELYKNWEFKILNFGSYENYEDVITIQQADSENEIEKRYSIEKYARGIGLVHKRQEILDTQCIAECQGQQWENKAEVGMILTKKLVGIN